MAVPSPSGKVLHMHLRKWDFVGGVKSTVFICYMTQHDLGLLTSLHDLPSDQDGQGEPLLELLKSAHLHLSSVWQCVGLGMCGCWHFYWGMTGTEDPGSASRVCLPVLSAMRLNQGAGGLKHVSGCLQNHSQGMVRMSWISHQRGQQEARPKLPSSSSLTASMGRT